MFGQKLSDILRGRGISGNAGRARAAGAAWQPDRGIFHGAPAFEGLPAAVCR